MRRIFELFRVFNNLAEEGNPKYLLPVEFSKLSEEALCNESVFSRFAGYLQDHYVKPPGPGADQPLSCSSACDYLNGAIQQAYTRFGTSSVYGRTSIDCHVFHTHSFDK